MQTIGAKDVKSKSSAPKSWEMNVRTDLSQAHQTPCKVQAPNSCKNRATATVIVIIRVVAPSNTHPSPNNHNTSQIWFHHLAFTSLNNSSQTNWHQMAVTDSTLESHRSISRIKVVFPAQIHTTIIINSHLKSWGMVLVNQAMWVVATPNPKPQICPNPKSSSFKIANTTSHSSKSMAQLLPKLKIITINLNKDNIKVVVFLTIISMAVLNSNKLEWAPARPWQRWWCKVHPSTQSSTIMATQSNTSMVASIKEPTSLNPTSTKIITTIINNNIDTKALVSSQSIMIPTTSHAINCKRRATHLTRLLMLKAPCSCWRWDCLPESSTQL